VKRALLVVLVLAFTSGVVHGDALGSAARGAVRGVSSGVQARQTPLQASLADAMRYRKIAEEYDRRSRVAGWIAVCIHERTGPYGGITERDAKRACADEAPGAVELESDGTP